MFPVVPTTSTGQCVYHSNLPPLIRRRMFYQMLEDYLSNLGMDGTNCLLRAICEAHELPFYSQGFAGEVLRLLLTLVSNS